MNIIKNHREIEQTRNALSMVTENHSGGHGKKSKSGAKKRTNIVAGDVDKMLDFADKNNVEVGIGRAPSGIKSLVVYGESQVASGSGVNIPGNKDFKGLATKMAKMGKGLTVDIKGGNAHIVKYKD